MSVKRKRVHQFIIVDPELCTGCETCESVCSFVHDGEFNPINTRIHRVRIEPIFNIALACQKCEDAPCIRSCPEKALDKDEDGSIIVDSDKCNGCGFCIDLENLSLIAEKSLRFWCYNITSGKSSSVSLRFMRRNERGVHRS